MPTLCWVLGRQRDSSLTYLAQGSGAEENVARVLREEGFEKQTLGRPQERAGAAPWSTWRGRALGVAPLGGVLDSEPNFPKCVWG